MTIDKRQMTKLSSSIATICRRGIAIVLGILVTVSLGACNPASFRSQAAQVPQVVFSIISDPKTFNAVLSAESPNVFGYIYEGLITENPITGKKEPALAESWQVSEDKLKFVFTLRKGLKWSDGQPLTADDVVFSYNDLYLNQNIPNNYKDSLKIGLSQAFPKIRQLDDRRVEFILPEPYAPFLDTAGLPILPAHILRKTLETKDAEGRLKFLSTWGVDTPPEQIIVNGPYKLKNFVTSQRVIFERNPYYWKKDKQGNRLPYIERVILAIVESQDTSLLQFRSGSLDSLSVNPEYFSLLKREEDRGKFTIYNGGPAYGSQFISFNLNKGTRNGKPLVNPIKSRWFNNVKFRQAVAYAIDRQRIINNIYQGLGAPINSLISIQSPYYNKTLKGYNYNPEKAKKLLQEAGFKYNSKEQLLDSEGNRVRFTLITNSGNKSREAMGAQIKNDLAKIGIQVDYTPIDFNVLVDKLSNSLDWECYLLGLTGDNEPHIPNVWLTDGNLHTFNQKPQPGQKPIEGWEVSEWEQKLAQLTIQGARELDIEKRKAIYTEIQRIEQEYLPMIYLVQPYSLGAVRDRFEGIQFSALGGAFWNLDEIKISSKKLR
ncbi:MAG: ABC transporter substrate-binding protein [Hydrococcus sp. C42_A2020_068]|nr:ABC transporter substrate-binding protein [Hydrococcus sp. C42_A2020_068]